MIEVADRLLRIEEYYFSIKLREVNLLKISGKPIINLGVGSPDLQPPHAAIKALTLSLDQEQAHKYQGYKGTPQLREAIAEFYRTHFDVYVSPVTDILPLMGSKEGIMHISMAFLNKGDHVLIPNPGYPTYTSITKLCKAKPVFYDLKEENNWLPDLEELEQKDLNKVKLMWISYPHMPTGANATKDFYKTLIQFAKKHQILIINDNPYSFILNDKPLSILSIEGSKKVSLELNSLSKTFNMAGWRVGFVLGYHKYINAILKVKSNMDSGMFYAIQQGAIKALQSSKLWFLSLNDVYYERRKLAWKLAKALNCTFSENATGMFVWAKLPAFVKSEEYIDLILKEKSIFIAPGNIFGSNGEGYIRISLCASIEDFEEAIARVK